MNRSNLSKLALLTIFIISIFSFIPLTFANTPDDWGPKPWPWQKGGPPAYLFKQPAWAGWSGGNWIGGWYWLGSGAYWEIPQNEYSWFRIGWAVSDFEIDEGIDPGPPYQYRLFIDGEEIHMRRYSWSVNKEEVEFPDGIVRTVHTRAWMWTVRFDPYFFELGEHEIRLQFLVKNPYYGSDSNKWRFYVNYRAGPWEMWLGPVGLVNNDYHILNVY